jgi:hypothetical protein
MIYTHVSDERDYGVWSASTSSEPIYTDCINRNLLAMNRIRHAIVLPGSMVLRCVPVIANVRDKQMIAYRIRVNRKPLVTAGQNDWSILSTHVTASRDNGERGVEDYMRLSIHGLSKENEQGFCEHFRWSEVDIEVGDIIELEIVDVGDIDPPKKRYRSDSQVRESPFTQEEWKEMRYKDYLELKKEFEGDDSA